MTDELRFDGRAAIVTGAGGDPSLGRAHALLLAARPRHLHLGLQALSPRSDLKEPA